MRNFYLYAYKWPGAFRGYISAGFPTGTRRVAADHTYFPHKYQLTCTTLFPEELDEEGGIGDELEHGDAKVRQQPVDLGHVLGVHLAHGRLQGRHVVWLNLADRLEECRHVLDDLGILGKLEEHLEVALGQFGGDLGCYSVVS